MIAEKPTLEKNLGNDFQCGIYNREIVLTTALRTSLTSSSVESLNSKSENDFCMDKVRDCSLREDSGNTPGNLNTTYLCPESDLICDGSGDSKITSINESKDLIKLKDDDDNWKPENKSWQYPNFFNLSNNFNTSHWTADLRDFKMENLTLDESRLNDENTDSSLLLRLRTYLADYQELRGTPRGEYTFSTLIRVMGHATGHCLLALFYVILNIAPVIEIFLHILRFILDKMIDIKNTINVQQIAIKTALFFAQLLSIYICLMFIFGFIVSPIIRMTFGIIAKIMLYD